MEVAYYHQRELLDLYHPSNDGCCVLFVEILLAKPHSMLLYFNLRSTSCTKIITVSKKRIVVLGLFTLV